MIERVSWAMYPKDERGRYELRDDWPRYLIMARAAIEAMREPTDGMVGHYTHNIGEWSRSTTEAMIDAALETSVNVTTKGEG